MNGVDVMPIKTEMTAEALFQGGVEAFNFAEKTQSMGQTMEYYARANALFAATIAKRALES